VILRTLCGDPHNRLILCLGPSKRELHFRSAGIEGLLVERAPLGFTLDCLRRRIRTAAMEKRGGFTIGIVIALTFSVMAEFVQLREQEEEVARAGVRVDNPTNPPKRQARLQRR